MPGLPAFLRTRSSAARRFRRSHTDSIKPLAPGRSVSRPFAHASTLAPAVAASPLPPSASSSWLLDFCGLACPRFKVVSPFPSFSPSPRLPQTTMASADFSLRRGRRHPFRCEARSPQIRALAFPARPPRLRRPGFGHKSFAVIGPLAFPASSRTRFLFIGPQFRSPLPARRPRGPTLCGSLRSL
jgi:hypothetical protein